MKCYKCECKPIASGKAFFPIDPKGTEGRRWACSDCMTEEQVNKIDPTVKEIADAVLADNEQTKGDTK